MRKYDISPEDLLARKNSFAEHGLADRLTTMQNLQAACDIAAQRGQPSPLGVSITRKMVDLLPESFSRLFGEAYEVTWDEVWSTLSLDDLVESSEDYRLCLNISRPAPRGRSKNRQARILWGFIRGETGKSKPGPLVTVSLGHLDGFGDLESEYWIHRGESGSALVTVIHDDIVGFLNGNIVPGGYTRSESEF